MFKTFFTAAAFVLASSPAFVSAQDFFFSFDENSRVPTTTVSSNTATGSLFIFADENLDFQQLDLDFTNDNSSVVSFTGGVVFNDGAALSGLASEAPGDPFTSFTSFSLLDPTGVTSGVTPTDGRLFATSFLSPGQVPGSGASNFRAGADGFLLAQVDFDIVGDGIANFDFISSLSPISPQNKFVQTTFGSATLNVEAVPEPSSAILLMLAAAGMVARRRRF